MRKKKAAMLCMIVMAVVVSLTACSQADHGAGDTEILTGEPLVSGDTEILTGEPLVSGDTEMLTGESLPSGENEAVLWLMINDASDYGFEVLHAQEGEIYGYTLSYREFMNLKADGTFTFSGGAADFGIGKIIFSGMEYGINKQVYSSSEYDVENELAVRYFANGESCSADEFDTAMNSQEQKTDVKWYELSDVNIDAVF